MRNQQFLFISVSLFLPIENADRLVKQLGVEQLVLDPNRVTQPERVEKMRVGQVVGSLNPTSVFECFKDYFKENARETMPN